MARPKPSRTPAGPKKPPLTHFLCLPLVTPASKPQLEQSMARFKEMIGPADSSLAGDATLQTTAMPEIHPKAIRPVGALHCTLGVMNLDEEALDAAIELLHGTDVSALLRQAGGSTDSAQTSEQTAEGSSGEKLASLTRPVSPPPVERSPTPLTVDLKGLVSMHPPHNTSILYTAPSDPSHRLYPFCIALQKSFAEAGLLVPDDRQLKLHATIVNTIYAKGRKRPPGREVRQRTPDPGQEDRSQGHGPNANAPLRIDATAWLERLKDFVWAENVVLDRVAICEMGAKKITDADGTVVGEEYTEVACVKLPV